MRENKSVVFLQVDKLEYLQQKQGKWITASERNIRLRYVEKTRKFYGIKVMFWTEAFTPNAHCKISPMETTTTTTTKNKKQNKTNNDNNNIKTTTTTTVVQRNER